MTTLFRWLLFVNQLNFELKKTDFFYCEFKIAKLKARSVVGLQLFKVCFW